MRTLATAAARGSDNFMWLRHAAAIMVLWAHSYGMSSSGLAEPLSRWLAGFDAGRGAVYLFFATSGYLIALSLVRNDAVLRYVWHRSLRIYPAYAACLLFCVFVVGATFTSLPIADYFAHHDTWLYFVHNWLPLSMQWGLPGVFEQNPYPRIVNGSLWSLGAEIRWYFFFGVFALLQLFRHRILFTLVAAALMIDAVRRHGLAPTDSTGSQAITQLFLLGALAALWRDRLPLSARLLGVLILLVGATLQTAFAGSLLLLTCVYFVLVVAYRMPALPRLREDWSYGIFLYGAPVQQSLVALWHDLPPLLLFLVGTVAATALAALSWRFVEQPALRQKHRFDRTAIALPRRLP
ncbi:MAG TPA: acyltransferase [Pseudomonadota bacterium]|jgi:peptidoglycan/LPS O-acetylase OafA/YrhL|nr:acyltransferase [Rhodanobacteraceae bacterium]MBP9154255.1 acyltransferase [Xanthomonadales bacterium]HQW80342.1 acyltransferase [Pseudomonadota bacterium]